MKISLDYNGIKVNVEGDTADIMAVIASLNELVALIIQKLPAAIKKALA